MIQFLLDGGDTTWVLAFDHIYDLLWKRKFLFLSNISVFDDIDGDVVIDKSDDVQIQIFNRALYFNDVLFSHFIAACVLDDRNSTVQLVQPEITVDGHGFSGFDMIEDEALFDTSDI